MPQVTQNGAEESLEHKHSSLPTLDDHIHHFSPQKYDSCEGSLPRKCMRVSHIFANRARALHPRPPFVARIIGEIQIRNLSTYLEHDV